MDLKIFAGKLDPFELLRLNKRSHDLRRAIDLLRRSCYPLEGAECGLGRGCRVGILVERKKL